MTMGTYRVLKRKGRFNLIETANPVAGVGYVVSNGSISFWSGEHRLEAEKQFDRCSKQVKATRSTRSLLRRVSTRAQLV